MTSRARCARPSALPDGPLADRIGRALATLLYELDVDRHRAWLVGVEAGNGSARARGARDRALEPLAVAIDAAGDGPGPATGAAAVGAIVELVYRHLTGPDAETALTALGAPVAFLVFAPLEGRRAALAARRGDRRRRRRRWRRCHPLRRWPRNWCRG